MNAEVSVREFVTDEWDAGAQPVISLTNKWRALGRRQKLVLGAAALLAVLVNAATVWSYMVCV